MIAFAVLGLALLAAGWFGYGRITSRRRAISLNWPDGLAAKTTERYARHYLHSNGWSLQESWFWLGVRIRAAKDGEQLNLLIADPSLLSLQTWISDANAIASDRNGIVTLMAYGFAPAIFKSFYCPKNVLLIAPNQMDHLVELLRERRLANADDARQRQERALQMPAKSGNDD
jgi:hypothetical protein